MPYEMSQEEIDMIEQNAFYDLVDAGEIEDDGRYNKPDTPRPGNTCSACGAIHKTPNPTSCHTCGHVTGLDR